MTDPDTSVGRTVRRPSPGSHWPEGIEAIQLFDTALSTSERYPGTRVRVLRRNVERTPFLGGNFLGGNGATMREHSGEHPGTWVRQRTRRRVRSVTDGDVEPPDDGPVEVRLQHLNQAVRCVRRDAAGIDEESHRRRPDVPDRHGDRYRRVVG